jgi:hypothetical protein
MGVWGRVGGGGIWSLNRDVVVIFTVRVWLWWVRFQGNFHSGTLCYPLVLLLDSVRERGQHISPFCDVFWDRFYTTIRLLDRTA